MGGNPGPDARASPTASQPGRPQATIPTRRAETGATSRIAASCQRAGRTTPAVVTTWAPASGSAYPPRASSTDRTWVDARDGVAPCQAVKSIAPVDRVDAPDP